MGEKMTSPSREAIEAACHAYAAAASPDGMTATWRLDGPLRIRMSAALSAALPHLAPAPSQSDEEAGRGIWNKWPITSTPHERIALIAATRAVVRAEEREACAKWVEANCSDNDTPHDIAAAIRGKRP